MDDRRTRIISAAMKAVRQYGEELMAVCFVCIDKPAAEIFERTAFDPNAVRTGSMGTLKSLWRPCFRFWVARLNETIFCRRFRDSVSFPEYNKSRDVTYFNTFIGMVRTFQSVFPGLKQINQDMPRLHVLTSAIIYAKDVAEGVLPSGPEAEWGGYV